MSSLFWGLFFIFLQGFFSGSETAVIMSDRLKLLTLKRKGNNLAMRALFIIEHIDSFIISMLSFTNICIVLSSTFITTFFVSRYGSIGTTFAIIITVFFSLIVGEYLPKVYAQIKREKVVLSLSGVYKILTYPFLFFSYIKKKKHIYSISRDDILSLLKEGEKAGSLVDRASGIAYKVLLSKKIKIKEIMTPIDIVKAISADWTRKKIKNYIKEFRFSRYPVYKKKKTNVVGIINVKDIVYNSKRLKRKPIFLTVEENIFFAMVKMQKQKQMMAIVKEGNKAVGLITMEDLIEEIVGEIRSEI